MTASLPNYTGVTADWGLIPDHMIGGLRRYIECGIKPGSFLTAILCNDLWGACACADSINKHRLFDYMAFLHNFAPHGSFGSPENFDAWIGRKGLGLPVPTDV